MRIGGTNGELLGHSTDSLGSRVAGRASQGTRAAGRTPGRPLNECSFWCLFFAQAKKRHSPQQGAKPKAKEYCANKQRAQLTASRRSRESALLSGINPSVLLNGQTGQCFPRLFAHGDSIRRPRAGGDPCIRVLPTMDCSAHPCASPELWSG